ncbi:MAG TPA: hypothetical protein VFE91_06985 [Nitrososphaerales archaeon]|nr:hypothetical protein [Nitrososphaerales archaeon]
MPDRGFRTITVTEAIYGQVKQRARREKKSAATYVSEILEVMLYIEDKFSNYAPFLELISLGEDDVVVRDHKKDRIAGVKAKSADGGKMRFYCELDASDYCPHTAFAAALPQVRKAIRS